MAFLAFHFTYERKQKGWQTGSIWLRLWESVGLFLWWEKSGRIMWLILHCIGQVSIQFIFKSIFLCIYSSFVPRESVQLISLLPSSRYCIVLVSLVQSSWDGGAAGSCGYSYWKNIYTEKNKISKQQEYWCDHYCEGPSNWRIGGETSNPL